MSAFYGQVEGMADTIATRRGGRDIKVSAQSWDGSVIVRMLYDEDKLMVDVQVSDDSSFYGQSLFYGTFDEFKKKLES